tara:strand:- start:68 stop:943 length:876 start_codon:yes stop_codon:yes gene_type:complete
MSKGGGSTNTIQKADPYIGQQPYLLDIYAQAQNQFNQPLQFFPGQTYANPTDLQIAAENLQANTALGGQTAVSQAVIPALQSQLAGPANVMNNPFLASATQAAIRPIYSQAQGLLQQARRDATRQGGLGGTRQAILEQGVIGDFMQRAGDISASMYSDAYNNALTAQSRALGVAPQTLASLQVPAQQLAQVGAVQQARQQQAIDDARARFEFAQMEPSNRLTRYANIAGTNILPGTTTSMADTGGGLGTIGALGALGGGIAGYNLGFGALTGGPAGLAAAATGAILGSLFD